MTMLTDEMIRRERTDFDRLERQYEDVERASDDLWRKMERKRALLAALGHSVDDQGDGEDGVTA